MRERHKKVAQEKKIRNYLRIYCTEIILCFAHFRIWELQGVVFREEMKNKHMDAYQLQRKKKLCFF